MTRDIDLVIECQPRDARTIVGLFVSDCYVDEDNVRDAIENRTMFNIIHNAWIIKADFIVRKDEPYRQVEFARRRRFRIEDVPVWVVAPEDLILAKLLWSKGSNSEIQRADARAIAQAVRDLDWTYLDRWARDLSVLDLLAEVRKA